MKNTFISILFLILVLAFSFGIALLVGDTSNGIDFWNSITLKSWGIIFGIQLVVFLPSFVFKTEHYFDLTGGLTFIIILAFLTFNVVTNSDLLNSSKLIPLFLVSLWAIRLSSFLFLRVKRT